MKFTPGPWKVCRQNELFDEVLFESDEKLPIVAIRAKNETIACAHDLFKFSEANAALIAAAPELLDALEMLLKETHDSVGKFKPALYAHCKAAISKAKGE